MESIISFLITIAFYAFIFRAIKRLAGKGKKDTAVKTKKTTITFGGKAGGDTKQIPGFMKGLLNQTGLSQIMESLEEAQRMQKEKLAQAVNEQEDDDYEGYEDEEFVEEPVYETPQPVARVKTTVTAQEDKHYSYSSRKQANKVIVGKDLKKAIIYSEIIAPPLAFRQ